MTRVLQADDVEPARAGLGTVETADAVRRLIRAPVEAASCIDEQLIACSYHPFVRAVELAYAEHHPLTLSPDMFWLVIAQGFANHVNDDPEKMRKHFVDHEGQKELSVRRDEFVKGDPQNDWADVYAELSERIRAEIGVENHESLLVRFSTTGSVERAANEVVLMATVQNYFQYTVMTLCGIPEVRLEGTSEDWALLAERTRNLGARYECRWWTDRLEPYLERVAACAAGAEDRDLWRTIYKPPFGSGDEMVGGWILFLFPYLQHGGVLLRCPFEEGATYAATAETWPGAMTSSPFTWKYLKKTYEMRFYGGFVGVQQDEETLALRPRIGWAVGSA